MESESPLPATSADQKEEMAVYRTKVIQFLGRTTPIILQNDNGPCPLLAICNILSLKNNLNLSPDIPEVSQEKLLGLVAERLIDGNTNVKDDDYAENQQQNIADAIDLLPRLTTGIDVNIQFRRIDDFEFTRECAIFDLLDIPLYHGWIVDPQDSETAGAIGSKSYNTLMGELVALETLQMESELKNNMEDDTVDFVAATTAALGVPSPSLSRGQSFNESPHKERKGDIEEEAELLKALKLSEEDKSVSLTDGIVGDDAKSKESALVNRSESATLPDTVKSEITNSEPVTLVSNEINACVTSYEPATLPTRSEVTTEKTHLFDDTNAVNQHADHETTVEKTASDVKIEDKKDQTPFFDQESVSSSSSILDEQKSDKLTQNESKPTLELVESGNVQNGGEGRDSSGLLASTTDSDSSSGQIHKIDEPESLTAIIDSSEPMYEGEECILESAISAGFENKEPVYEGEVVLAEQVNRDCKIDGYVNSKVGVSAREGELIKTFIKNSASQLTIYGLFCLLDKVKERELCVFFRNNHFNTMFKYEGELYILATDQGYLNQPDLVWEKLNEVNGNTVFMTGKFKEFKVDDQSNSSWDEQSAMTNTADYLANIDGQEQSSFNSDLQLAMALQQQEFDQQQQQQSQQQRNVQETAVSGSSGLVTGPQVHRPRPTPPTSKQESKSKEKCTIM